MRHISNYLLIVSENHVQRDSLEAPNIILSTYIWKINKLSFLSDLMNKVELIRPLEKPFVMRKELSLSYQALGACFRP